MDLEYIKNANKYMEEHWQFHNHLDHERHQNRLKYTAEFCKGRTLEVGCANGFSTETMAQHNPKAQFEGYELTDWGYQQALNNYPHRKFYQGLGEKMPFKDKEFDTILLAEIIEHCQDPEVLKDEAFRVGKRVIITTPTVHHNDPDHKRFITIAQMRELVKPYEAKIYGLTVTGGRTENEKDIYFQIVVVDSE